mmetsp:Transcript_749/g.1806  ORF Transcript_749/g.1806 Transcript_749/m.1806 type:complete len:277 (+) Transcript_749:160-990(+)
MNPLRAMFGVPFFRYNEFQGLRCPWFGLSRNLFQKLYVQHHYQKLYSPPPPPQPKSTRHDRAYLFDKEYKSLVSTAETEGIVVRTSFATSSAFLNTNHERRNPIVFRTALHCIAFVVVRLDRNTIHLCRSIVVYYLCIIRYRFVCIFWFWFCNCYCFWISFVSIRFDSIRFVFSLVFYSFRLVRLVILVVFCVRVCLRIHQNTAHTHTHTHCSFTHSKTDPLSSSSAFVSTFMLSRMPSMHPLRSCLACQSKNFLKSLSAFIASFSCCSGWESFRT